MPGSLDHLRQSAISSRQHALLRVRAEVERACREYLDGHGFVAFDAPILTPAACEGTTTLFPVEYFGETAYLTQSGQLYAEAGAIYNAVTGFDLRPEEFRRAGERITNLKKAFNIREGWRREDDTLPPRILTDALSGGAAQGVGLSQAELDLMIDGYYRARGWTLDGMIPEAKLQELGLGDLAHACAEASLVR